MECNAICLARTINIHKLQKYLKEGSTQRFKDILYHKLDGYPDSSEGDLFVFHYGVIVFWGCAQEAQKKLINDIYEYLEDPIADPHHDDFSYSYGSEGSFKDDVLVLPANEHYTKLAFSHGFAQSVKLDYFEDLVKSIEMITRQIPIDLAKSGTIKLSRKKIRKMMGNLYMQKSAINLKFDLLDTPDFFWEHSDLEKYYLMTSKELDKDRRVAVINKQLECNFLVYL